mmetsp:Transcript_21782/g.67120  ORF Transcript_21782/g.67120 Transcript_21782/m.67120 type:complete len:268 (-) Transcript_21782:510-1313(-)
MAKERVVRRTKPPRARAADAGPATSMRRPKKAGATRVPRSPPERKRAKVSARRPTGATSAAKAGKVGPRIAWERAQRVTAPRNRGCDAVWATTAKEATATAVSPNEGTATSRRSGATSAAWAAGAMPTRSARLIKAYKVPRSVGLYWKVVVATNAKRTLRPPCRRANVENWHAPTLRNRGSFTSPFTVMSRRCWLFVVVPVASRAVKYVHNAAAVEKAEMTRKGLRTPKNRETTPPRAGPTVTPTKSANWLAPSTRARVRGVAWSAR